MEGVAGRLSLLLLMKKSCRQRRQSTCNRKGCQSASTSHCSRSHVHHSTYLLWHTTVSGVPLFSLHAWATPFSHIYHTLCVTYYLPMLPSLSTGGYVPAPLLLLLFLGTLSHLIRLLSLLYSSILVSRTKVLWSHVITTLQQQHQQRHPLLMNQYWTSLITRSALLACSGVLASPPVFIHSLLSPEGIIITSVAVSSCVWEREIVRVASYS